MEREKSDVVASVVWEEALKEKDHDEEEVQEEVGLGDHLGVPCSNRRILSVALPSLLVVLCPFRVDVHQNVLRRWVQKEEG